jgi:hypothetical protein
MKNKKKYTKPTLTIHGKLSEITLSAGSANGDAGQNMMTPNEFEF